MSDFTSIASIYRQSATLQMSGAERLFWMLVITRDDDILDLGCGTGHLAQELRLLTDGRVVGIDASAAMIDLARQSAPPTIEFVVGTAEEMDMPDAFDAIFCNSAFQWFVDAARALVNCHAALRAGGRMAMQAPAHENYCPLFVRAVATLARDPRTRETFAHFRSPWTFRETGQEYARLFADAGFSVVSSEIEELKQRTTPEKALEMFDSGAAAAYLNPGCYDVPLPEDYADTARELILSDFRAQAAVDGLLEVVIYRVYVLARKA